MPRPKSARRSSRPLRATSGLSGARVTRLLVMMSSLEVVAIQAEHLQPDFQKAFEALRMRLLRLAGKAGWTRADTDAVGRSAPGSCVGCSAAWVSQSEGGREPQAEASGLLEARPYAILRLRRAAAPRFRGRPLWPQLFREITIFWSHDHCSCV